MAHNGDKKRVTDVDGNSVVGLGNFHKTLPHNEYGEVDKHIFERFVNETESFDPKFKDEKKGKGIKCLGTSPNDKNALKCIKNPFDKKDLKKASLTNPRAGLAEDRLVAKPSTYEMPPAPPVLSNTTAAEMTELYWMAILRDASLDTLNKHKYITKATNEINKRFNEVLGEQGDGSLLQKGIDIPGSADEFKEFTPKTLFRLGLPGEESGPLVSQFFIRDINYGTQTIDQKIRPYKKEMNYLTKFSDWLCAQNTGNGQDGLSYSKSNEASASYYEKDSRYISTMRDFARFVNKDALHQAYFNAALLMLSGGAKWTDGNPYGDCGRFSPCEAGFGTLGGPHILNLVSEVATRALKIIWFQKWQTHLRLRPEAYGGLVHVQNTGIGKKKNKRAYGLPEWVANTEAAKLIKKMNGDEGLLLPMAFTAGSPTHPAYGAGHATVAGVCITVLKAFFKTVEKDSKTGAITPISLVKTNKNPNGLTQNEKPYLPKKPVAFNPFKVYETGISSKGNGTRQMTDLDGMTIEGELNKLASNVSMGRSMGGVHWRTDNTRSLTLGEAIAAAVLANITEDLAEKPKFEFRTFSRKWNGEPKYVEIEGGNIIVDGVTIHRCEMDKDTYPSAL